MAWRLEATSGPRPGPWEGKDAVSWVWEIYGDDESRRVLVEVSGTAMSMADEYLPKETADARATNGRSEVEKVLDNDDPPARISLGSTGYLSSVPGRARPDLLIKSADGHIVSAIEVKNPEVLTAPLAVVVRDRLAPQGAVDNPRFVLIVSQDKGFLFDLAQGDPYPTAEFDMFGVVARYYPPARREQRFREKELEIIVHQWLRELMSDVEGDEEADRALRDAGFQDAVRGGAIEVQPA